MPEVRVPPALTSLRADVANGFEGAGPVRLLTAVMTVRFWAVLLFRLSQAAGSGAPLLGSIVKQLNHLLTGADLAWQATVGPGLVLYHPTGVVIGPHVALGAGAVLQQGVTIGGDGGRAGGAGASPTIGDRLVMGAGARIFGAVRLGDDVVVGANAVVTKDVPPGATVAGVPARILGEAR